MPKRLMCSQCGEQPRLGGKQKWGKMNDLCLDCTVEQMNKGVCPSCGHVFENHAEKCVTRKVVDVEPTASTVDVSA